MAILKKKTRKAISKSLKKLINKHGPVVAEHIATGLVASLATYLGAEGEKGVKKLKKAAKALPAGKKLSKIISATGPLLHDTATKVTGDNGHNKTKRRSRSKKPATA